MAERGSSSLVGGGCIKLCLLTDNGHHGEFVVPQIAELTVLIGTARKKNLLVIVVCFLHKNHNTLTIIVQRGDISISSYMNLYTTGLKQMPKQNEHNLNASWCNPMGPLALPLALTTPPVGLNAGHMFTASHRQRSAGWKRVNDKALIESFTEYRRITIVSKTFISH